MANLTKAELLERMDTLELANLRLRERIGDLTSSLHSAIARELSYEQQLCEQRMQQESLTQQYVRLQKRSERLERWVREHLT